MKTESENRSDKSQTAPCNIDGVSVSFPLEKDCHCGSIADKYLTKKFKNHLDQTVVKIFYRCRNCRSRLNHCFIPKLESLKTINVFDLLKN